MVITFDEIKAAGLEATGLEWVRGQKDDILRAGLLMFDLDLSDVVTGTLERARPRPTGRSIDSTVEMIDGRRFRVIGLNVKSLIV